MAIEELNIKSEREKRNLTQQEFADLLGVTRKTIANYEAGGKIPSSKKVLFQEILDNNSSNELKKGLNMLGKKNGISVDDFVDVFFLYKEEILKNERFISFLDGLKKDAIIEYQHFLIKESKK